MSTFSHSQDEERGKQPAREAPGEQGEVPRKRDDSKDDKSDPASAGWPIASPCVTNDTKTRERGARGCKKTQLRHHALYFLFDITTGGIKWRFIRKG